MQRRLRELNEAIAAGDWERARTLSTALARSLRLAPIPQRFWQPADRKVLLVWAVVCAIAWVAYEYGRVGALASLVGRPLLILMLLSFANFLPVAYTTLVYLMQREHVQGTAVFLRLTRLSGADLLWGAYTAYALAGATRLYLVWLALPLMALSAIVYDSLWHGASVALRVGLCIVAVSWLWQTLLGLCATRTPTLLWQIGVSILIVGVGASAWLGAVALAGYLIAQSAVASLNATPFWAWFGQSAFWASVAFPQLGVVLCAVVTHPLWGVLHALLWWGIARLLAPVAARRLQQMLNAPEPELKPQEGAWW